MSTPASGSPGEFRALVRLDLAGSTILEEAFAAGGRALVFTQFTNPAVESQATDRAFRRVPVRTRTG